MTWDSTLDPYYPYSSSGAIQILNASEVKEKDGTPVILHLLIELRRGRWRVRIPDEYLPDSLKGTPQFVWRGASDEPILPAVLRRFPLLSGKKLPSGLPQDNGIRAYIIEGISEMADLLLSENGRKTRGVNEGKSSNLKLENETLSDSDSLLGMNSVIDFGAPTQSHYQMVKQEVLLNFLKTGIFSLPLDAVICTMHEAKGVSEIETGAIQLGPDMPGQKAIGSVVQKFGFALHLQSALEPKNPLPTFRAYFVPHFGAPGTTLSQKQWPAKLSLSPSSTVKLLKKYPEGFIPLHLDPKLPSNTVSDILEHAWEN